MILPKSKVRKNLPVSQPSLEICHPERLKQISVQRFLMDENTLAELRAGDASMAHCKPAQQTVTRLVWERLGKAADSAVLYHRVSSTSPAISLCSDFCASEEALFAAAPAADSSFFSSSYTISITAAESVDFVF